MNGQGRLLSSIVGRARSPVGTAFFAAAALTGCRALLDLPPIGAEDSPDSGLESGISIPTTEAGSEGGPSCATVVRPAEGDYTYALINSARKGEEQIFVLSADGKNEDSAFGGVTNIPDPPNTTFSARLTHGDNNTYLTRFFFNSGHTDEYTFQAAPNAGLQVVNVKQRQFNDAFNVNAKCDPPVDVIRCGMLPNETWRAAPVGTFTFGDNAGSFNTVIDFTYVVDDDAGLVSQLSVNGKLVDTYHLKETRTLKGNIFGVETAEYWFARENGLLIQAMFKAGDISSKKVDGLTMTLGTVPLEFKGHAEFLLTDLTPKPLPDAGAPADAGEKDAAKDAKKD